MTTIENKINPITEPKTTPPQNNTRVQSASLRKSGFTNQIGFTVAQNVDRNRPAGPHISREIDGKQEYFSHKTNSNTTKRVETNGTGSHYSSWRHWIGDSDWTWGQYGSQAEADFNKNEVVQITGSKGRILGFAIPMHSEKYGYGYEIRGTGESGDKPYYAFVDANGNVNSFEQDPTNPNKLKKVSNSSYDISEPSSLTQTNGVGPFTALTIAEQIHADGESESLREHAGNAAKLEVGLRNTIGAAFGGTDFDPEVGPTWGDKVADTLGESASVSVRSEWGLKGGITYGPGEVNTTFRFRTKVSPPRLGQDANGNPRAVMTVSFVEETESGVGVGADISAGPLGATAGASASHGTDSGISVDLIWDPQKQTFVLPTGKDGKLDKGKVSFFQESFAYADAEVGLSLGQKRQFRNLSGGAVNDFSGKTGLNLDGGGFIATGRTLSWDFNNSQAIHAARGLSIFSKIPLLGHLGLGIAIAAGTANKDETYSTGGFIGTTKASIGVDIPKINGGFGVTGGAFARTRVVINYPIYPETDDTDPRYRHPYPGPNDLTPEEIDEANNVLNQPNPADNPTNLQDLENYRYQTYRRERPFVNGVRVSGGREVKNPEYVNFAGRWFVVVNPSTGEIRAHDPARDGRINVDTLEPVSNHRPHRQ